MALTALLQAYKIGLQKGEALTFLLISKLANRIKDLHNNQRYT